MLNKSNRILTLLFISVLLLSSSAAVASSYSYNWTPQATLDAQLNVIAALDQERALAAGLNMIGGTSDYGKTWTFSSESYVRYDISFYSASDGVLVGADSRIDSVTNEASTGRFFFSAFPVAFPLAGASLESCSFVTANNGWVAGQTSGGAGIIYNWNGAAWAPQLSVAGSIFNKIAFVDVNNGFAVGSSGGNKVIYQTVNGGAAWNPVTPAAAGTGAFNNVNARAAGDVWAAGDGGKVFHWNGAAWTDLSVSDTTDLFGVRFINNTEGWAVGNGGKAYHTTNAGVSWGPEPVLDPTYNLKSITFAGQLNGWLLGQKAGGSVIYRYTAVPQIDTLTPAAIVATSEPTTLVITVEGDRFLGTANSTIDAPAVAFGKGGFSASLEVGITQVKYIGQQTIEVTASVSSDASGLYDLVLANRDGGTVTKLQALKVLPSFLSIQDLKIDGLLVQNGTVETVRKTTPPTLYFYVSSPGDVSQLTITGEVTIGATLDSLAATRFTTAGDLATLESYSFSGTLESGTYSANVTVYVDKSQTSESFSLTITPPSASFPSGYAVANILVTNPVAGPADRISLLLDTNDVTVLSTARAVVIAGGGPGDIYYLPLTVDPHGARVMQGGTEAIRTKVSFQIPPDMPRAMYAVFLQGADGKRLSGMSRFAVAKTAH